MNETGTACLLSDRGGHRVQKRRSLSGLDRPGKLEQQIHFFVGKMQRRWHVPVKVLADLRRRLEPLAQRTSPLSVPPPRKTRFGSPLVLSRVHWVEPRLVAEITYLTWTVDNLLRHTVYIGLREDKPDEEVRRER